MKRLFIGSLAILAAALLLSRGAMAASDDGKESESDPFQKLSVDDVAKRLSDPNVHIYDGNNDKVYTDGHLPGAVHLFSKDIKEGTLPADKDTTLIFYCHNTL
jgi:rhodanese-like protein